MTSSPPDPSLNTRAGLARSSWFVPPIVIPVVIILMIIAMVTYQALV